jgi:hypothetical protein
MQLNAPFLNDYTIRNHHPEYRSGARADRILAESQLERVLSVGRHMF